MRYLLALSVLAVALAAPAAAPAGGWATVELAAMPAGIDAGDTWTARFTVLRHGATPTDGAEPSVTIVHPVSSETSTFPAAPAGEPGVYEAAVVFPEAGTWTFEIDNGLAATGYGESQTTTFDPVTVGAPRRRRRDRRRRAALTAPAGRARPAARARRDHDLRHPAPEGAGSGGPLSAALSGGTSIVATV